MRAAPRGLPLSTRWLHPSAVVLHLLLVVGLGLLTGLGPGLMIVVLLLVPTLGIVRGRRYTCAWASMLIAFYAAGLLAEAYMWPSRRLLMLVLATLAALEFAALVLYVRVAAREAQAAASPPGTDASDGP